MRQIKPALMSRAVAGRTATLVLPSATYFPVHFKRDLATGSPLTSAAGAEVVEAYLRNDSIPWEGAIPDCASYCSSAVSAPPDVDAR